MTILSVLRAAVLVALGMTAPVAVLAQPYPSQPIKIIVPYPPGGNADLIARTYAEPLGKLLGTAMVIDNRPGAGAIIGTEAGARSAPDGYTLLHATNSETTVIPAVRSNLPYDPAKDLVAISRTSQFPFMLVTRKDLPVRSVEEFVALAKQQPGKLTLGSVGTGSANHLVIEPFKAKYGIDVLHVPYKGAGPVLTDILGGHLDGSFATVSSMLQQVRSGDLRALMVTSRERFPQLPDVPSAGELGLDDVVTENWTAFFVPAGTDQAIVRKLNDAIVRVGKMPEIVEAIRKAGSNASTSTSAEISAVLKTDLARWRKITTEKGITVD